jgi:hypothetical protein
VSAWVTEAWRRVGGTELLYAAMSDDFVARHADLHDRIGLFAERAVDGPASYPPDQIALACELSEVALDRKRRALSRHASQTGPLAALMGEDTYRRWWRTEWFRRPTELEVSSCALCPVCVKTHGLEEADWTDGAEVKGAPALYEFTQGGALTFNY